MEIQLHVPGAAVDVLFQAGDNVCRGLFGRQLGRTALEAYEGNDGDHHDKDADVDDNENDVHEQLLVGGHPNARTVDRNVTYK